MGFIGYMDEIHRAISNEYNKGLWIAEEIAERLADAGINAILTGGEAANIALRDIGSKYRNSTDECTFYIEKSKKTPNNAVARLRMMTLLSKVLDTSRFDVYFEDNVFDLEHEGLLTVSEDGQLTTSSIVIEEKEDRDNRVKVVYVVVPDVNGVKYTTRHGKTINMVSIEENIADMIYDIASMDRPTLNTVNLYRVLKSDIRIDEAKLREQLVEANDCIDYARVCVDEALENIESLFQCGGIYYSAKAQCYFGDDYPDPVEDEMLDTIARFINPVLMPRVAQKIQRDSSGKLRLNSEAASIHGIWNSKTSGWEDNNSGDFLGTVELAEINTKPRQ